MENQARNHKAIIHYKSRIDAKLKNFLTTRLARSAKISPVAKDMMEHILEFSLRGGKRLRPILLIYGYKAAKGKDEKSILDCAIAAELMESFLLIHDDIMDQDELRRGYLTEHRIYENKCKKTGYSGDCKRYGENMAIILGDILAVLGSEAILNSNFPVKNKLLAVDRFNRAVINTCIGQAYDINLGIKDQVSEYEVLDLYLMKTALYTIDAPLQIGAILAGADKKTLSSITGFSIPMGQAFQLQDDILGLFGSQKEFGKPIGSDIREGKKTLLIVRAIRQAKETDRRFLQRCLGNEKITAKDIEKVKRIIIETGSLAYCKKIADRMMEKAVLEIRVSKIDNQSKEFLVWLCDYIISRSK
jgi:geranylgeranyl diphosphate synthase, type I